MIRRSAADPPATASGKRKRYKAPNSGSKRQRTARPHESQQVETLPEPTEPISGIDNSVTDVPQKLQSWDVGEDLWHLIASFLAEPIELNWPYKSAEAYEGASNTVIQMEKVRWAWKDLSSLTRTCRWMFGVATPWLYRWVSLENAQSAASFLNTLYHRPERQGYVHHIAITSILDEQLFRSALRKLKWTMSKTTDYENRSEFIHRGVRAILNRRTHQTPKGPLALLMIFSELRRLASVHLSEPIFPDELLRNPSNVIQGTRNREGASSKPMLSELSVIMRGAGEAFIPFTAGPDDGVKRLHLASETCFEEHIVCLGAMHTTLAIDKVERLQLSFVYMDGHCWQSCFSITQSLRELHIRLAGVGNPAVPAWVDHLNDALPTLANTLETLTIDSCYVRSFNSSSDRRLLSNLPRLQNLARLRIPAAFLFRNPEHVGDAVVLELLPKSLTALEMQEIWAQNDAPSSESQHLYSIWLATFLEVACAQLASLSLLRFFYQWEYCLKDATHRLASASNNVTLDIVPLESSSPEALSKLARTYLSAGDHDRAKQIASEVSQSSALSRGTTIRLAQVYAGVGLLEDGTKLLTRLHPPASQVIVRSISDMLQHRRGS